MDGTNSKINLRIDGLRIGLSKGSNPTNLVDNVGFDLYKGEILGVVGESGSGKSLTSLAVLRLLSPALKIKEGSIFFQNMNLLQLNEREIRKIRGKEIAMIFQEPLSSLNPSMRCGDQIDEMMLTHQEISKADAKARTLHLLEQTKIGDPKRAYRAFPHEMSGGQLQRVMIAMAIACNPSVLIADECTTALDVTVQKEIMALIKQLTIDMQLSTIFVSHDLGVISEIADRVLVLRKGRIVEMGDTDQVLNYPKQAYTKSLIASRPPLKTNLSILPTEALMQDVDWDRKMFVDTYGISNEDMEHQALEWTQAPIILEVQNLSKSFVKKKNFWGIPESYVQAVQDVSFELKKGKCLGLVGESGCGKSTLSKLIVRLIEADKGAVLFQNKNILQIPNVEMRKLRHDIQYIFQDPYSSLNPRISIGEAIVEPMYVHGIGANRAERKAKAIELLKRVGLEADHFQRYPHEFSGGQRQRICIARALGLQPKVLICDEIVSALDVSVQAQVLNLLKELQHDFNMSIIFVSHDLSVIKFISDFVLVMHNGRIVESGFPEIIFNHAQEAYTKTLIQSIPGKDWI